MNWAISLDNKKGILRGEWVSEGGERWDTRRIFSGRGWSALC